MIANHKRLASDLVQKYDQAILMLRKKAGRGRIEDEKQTCRSPHEDE